MQTITARITMARERLLLIDEALQVAAGVLPRKTSSVRWPRMGTPTPRPVHNGEKAILDPCEPQAINRMLTVGPYRDPIQD